MPGLPAPHLSHEVLDDIFARSINTLELTEANKLLATFSLVAKGWTGVAQRRMLATIVVRGGKQARELIDRNRRFDDRGGARQSLVLVFQLLRTDSTADTEVPNVKQIEQQDMISHDAFVSLLKATPRLYGLTLELPTFPRFRRRVVEEIGRAHDQHCCV